MNHSTDLPEVLWLSKTVTIEDLSWYSRDFARVKSKLSKRIAKDFGFKGKDNIILTAAKIFLLNRYVMRGDKILIPKETWWYYKKVAYEVGGFNVEYPMIKRKDDGMNSYLYDVDKMISIYDREKTRVYYCVTNNPTEIKYQARICTDFWRMQRFDSKW